MTIGSILIANRGEIACRIMKTARNLGIRSVAVFSEPDHNAVHVAMADDSFCIGPGEAAESYLSIERIVEAARKTGVGAIHPGYGFLSENAAFAEAVVAAGLVFIGPSADAIAVMGDKAEARQRMIDAGIPCLPGYQGKDQSVDRLAAEAAEIGLPVMVKAAAGGGGKGMRLVETPDALPDAIMAARAEAESAFGSGDLIIEKALLRPRHVEIQIFADTHGNSVHLGERDCSIQRRHQKIIEEAPSPAVSAELREKMGTAAVAAARTIGYAGAGTVEFLLGETGEFYFLEMNTRLQVEHPVTEMITGLDLVALQIAVAGGEKLGFGQDDISFSGHAIEARLYAEDPTEGFLPSPGLLRLWSEPGGEAVRVDAGVAGGDEISAFYDPLMAKIVVWGESREIARKRLLAALGQTVACGVATNRDFLMSALSSDSFVNREATTSFVAENFPDGYGHADGAELLRAARVAAILWFLAQRETAFERSGLVSRRLANWSSAYSPSARVALSARDDEFRFAINAMQDTCHVADDSGTVEVEIVSKTATTARLRMNQDVIDLAYVVDEATIFVSTNSRDLRFSVLRAGRSGRKDAAMAGQVVAPMHGRITELCVAQDQPVESGARLVVLEAMKMQHQLSAPVDGKVTAIHAEVGKQVAAGDLLIEIDPDTPRRRAEVRTVP